MDTEFPDDGVVIFTLVAPVDESTILLLLYVPVADAFVFNLILNVPDALPLDCVNVAVLP